MLVLAVFNYKRNRNPLAVSESPTEAAFPSMNHSGNISILSSIQVLSLSFGTIATEGHALYRELWKVDAIEW